LVRPIRAENLATTEGVVAVVVAAVLCGVAATTTQIGKI
jgi:hypothetical protein